MKDCVLLTMDDCSGYCIYDHYLHEPLKASGWRYHTISWRNKECNWNDYDVVIIRSTWDYQQHKDEFLIVLSNIDQSSARLENNFEIIKWNINKNYLRDLERNGCQIIPTIWPDFFSKELLLDAFKQFNTDKIIIKPRVSANANNTIIINKFDLAYIFNDLQKIFSSNEFLLQPFMPNIINEGEYSIFYFAGQFSHAILKNPKAGDFRVQEEHGGILQLVNPEKNLLNAGNKLNEYFGKSLLYARFDFVRDTNNNFCIMEVELIEPSLYFNLDPLAANRFVKALEYIIN